MSALPLPFFHKITQAVTIPTADGLDHGWMILIAPDPMAGHRGRYSVLKMNCQTGKTSRVGRELPLGHSKQIAEKVRLKLERVRRWTTEGR